MMEETNPLVTEKLEFLNRDESSLIALFGIFGLLSIRCEVQNTSIEIYGFPKIRDF